MDNGKTRISDGLLDATAFGLGQSANIVKIIRSETYAPIVAVVPKNEIEEALVAGADVCFDPNTTLHIVFAHIMAMLRRFELYDNYDRTEYSKSILYRGNLVIDPWRQHVTLDGLEVTLRPREFRLLTYMAKNPGIVLTPSMLSAAIWSDDSGYEKEVAKSVSELRRALGDSKENPNYIETVRGVGYRFLFED